MLARLLVIGLVTFLAATPVAASDGADAAARIDADRSRIEDFGADLRIELTLSQPVPWRVHTLDAPRRLVVEFDGVDLSRTGLDAIVASDCVSALRLMPRAVGGWQRIELTLTVPLRIETAGMTPAGPGAALKLQLAPTSAEDFSRLAGQDPNAALAPPRTLRLFSRVSLGPDP